MNSQPPRLSQRDIEAELEHIHRLKHRGSDRGDYTTALYGTASEARAEVSIDGRTVRFRIVPVGSELQLRRALAEQGEALRQDQGGEQLALVAEFGDGNAPLDLQGALSGGRIYGVTRADQLARRLGAKMAAADLSGSPIADALLAEPEALALARGAVADLDFAVRIWLKSKAGLDLLEGDISAERVLAFCATSQAGTAFAQACDRFAGVREALLGWLRKTAGEVAALALQDWLRGEGRRPAALAVLLEAAAAHLDDAMLRPRLRSLLGQSPQLEVLRTWAALADPILRRLDTQSGAAVVQAADALLPDAELQPLFAGSLRLPSAFSTTKGSLARAVTEFLARPSSASIAPPLALVDRLRKHLLAQDAAQEAVVQRTVMAARLMAYLLWRTEKPIAAAAPDEAVYAAGIRLAQHQAEQGGFVDFARRIARGGQGDPLGAAINEVVKRVDELRDADDARFGQALQPWIDARRKSDEVLPIDQALDRIAAPFLEGNTRRLLVLLLDGMAWENAAELALDLEARHVGPLSWKPPAVNLRGTLLPPVLAAFPTLTDVSRSAFFGGKLISPNDRDTSKDPERFAQHRGLRRVLGSEEPKLLLRPELQAEGGHASKEALQLVGSAARVVGLVVNAIDEQLKAGQQMHVAYTVDGIKPLRDLLEAADRAGRAVLIASDHGHVSGARLKTVPLPGASGGARWRPLSQGEAARPNEVRLSGEGVCVPRGTEAVAMLVSETERFATASHDGEHGGASLAECIAPLLLVGHESLAQGSDPALEQRAFPRPAFWDLLLPSGVAQTQPAAVPSRKKPTPQLAMFEPKASTPPPAVARGVWFKRLEGILAGRSQLLDDVARRLDVLLAADGQQLAPEVFASRAGILAYRVSGAVAAMQEVLNLDGYEVVEYNPSEQIVRLNRQLFTMLFEEDPR